MSQNHSPHSSQAGVTSPPFPTQHSQYSASNTSPRLVFSWDPYNKDFDSRQQSMLVDSDQEDRLLLPPPEELRSGSLSGASSAGSHVVPGPLEADSIPGPFVTTDTAVYEEDESGGRPMPPGSAPGTRTQPPSTMNRNPKTMQATTASVVKAVATSAGGSLADSPYAAAVQPPAVAPLTLSDVLSGSTAKSPYISPRLLPMGSGAGTPRALSASGHEGGTPTSGRLHIVAQGRPNDARRYYLDFNAGASLNGSGSGGGGGGLGESGMAVFAATPFSENAVLANSMGSHSSSHRASAAPAALVRRHSPYGTPRAAASHSDSVTPHHTPFALASSLDPDAARRHELDFATTEELGRVEGEPSAFLTLMVPPPPSCRALVMTIGEVQRIVSLCERWIEFAQAFLRGRRDGAGEMAEAPRRLAAALERLAPEKDVLVAALATLPALPALNIHRPRSSSAEGLSAWAVVPDPQLAPPMGDGAAGISPAEVEQDQRALESWYAQTVAWWQAMYPTAKFDIAKWSRSAQAAIDAMLREPRGPAHANNNSNNGGGGYPGRGMRGGNRGGRGGPFTNYPALTTGFFPPQQPHPHQAYYDPFTMSDPTSGGNTQWSVMSGGAGFQGQAQGGFQGQPGAGTGYGWALPGGGGGGAYAAPYGGYEGSGRGIYSGMPTNPQFATQGMAPQSHPANMGGHFMP